MRLFALLVFVVSLFFAPLTARAQEDPVVVFETSKGTVFIKLDRTHAPLSTENFLRYVQSGFYNNTIFHRVIKSKDMSIVQGGVQAQSWLLLGLAVSAGLITLLYMVRTWQHIFQRSPGEQLHLKPVGDSVIAPALLVSLCVLLGLYAVPLVEAATIAVNRLGDPNIYIRAVLGG
jgi:hypothetical protein